MVTHVTVTIFSVLILLYIVSKIGGMFIRVYS